MKKLKVTQLESQVLNALAQSMYAEFGFSDAGLDEVEAITKLDSKTIRGVISSLVKKGLVYVDKREDEGYKNQIRMHIWYLDGDAKGLVEHWVEEGSVEKTVIEIN